MKLSKIMKHAFNMVIHSKLRSWLTIIGIVIGVAAVIAIVSIGEGMEQSLSAQMGDLGGDTITITPGFSQSTTSFGSGRNRDSGSTGATEDEVVLDRGDLQALKSIPEISFIDTNIKGNVDVSYLGKSGSVTLTGVDQKVWSDVTTGEIAEGRMLDSADQNVVVIGGRLARDFFDQPIGINKMVTIEDNAFRVVGILDDTSTNIYMPISMAYQVLEDKENNVYDTIILKVKDEDTLDATIEKIEKKLMVVRHVNEKTRDFTVISSQQTLEARAEMMASMNAFLLAIAAISLIVGSVGIANTMFTSVLEKTKEIGIMKAIGARNKDILLIFIFNAGFIGLVGGILGIALGTLMSGSMGLIMPEMRLFGTTIVSLNSVIMALLVSVIIGILAGFIPAYNGSKLKPVDALRYE